MLAFWDSFLPTASPHSGYAWGRLLCTPYHLPGTPHFHFLEKLACSHTTSWLGRDYFVQRWTRPSECLSEDVRVWDLCNWASLFQVAKILRFKTLMSVAIVLPYYPIKNKATFKEKHRRERVLLLSFVCIWKVLEVDIFLPFLKLGFLWNTLSSIPSSSSPCTLPFLLKVVQTGFLSFNFPTKLLIRISHISGH